MDKRGHRNDKTEKQMDLMMEKHSDGWKDGESCRHHGRKQMEAKIKRTHIP